MAIFLPPLYGNTLSALSNSSNMLRIKQWRVLRACRRVERTKHNQIAGCRQTRQYTKSTPAFSKVIQKTTLIVHGNSMLLSRQRGCEHFCYLIGIFNQMLRNMLLARAFRKEQRKFTQTRRKYKVGVAKEYIYNFYCM